MSKEVMETIERRCAVLGMLEYGYVNPGGQEAIQREIVYRLKVYMEARRVIQNTWSPHVVSAMRKLQREISLN
jgi:hypothetical protein